MKQITPNLVVCNNNNYILPFIILVGWKFWHSMGEMASEWLGPQVEDSEPGGWNDQKAHAFTCLVLNVGAATCGFSMWPGVLPNMVAGLKVSILKDRKRRRQKPYIASNDLASEVIWHHFCNIENSFKVSLGSRKGSTDANGDVPVSLCRRACEMGYVLNTFAAGPAMFQALC